MIIRFTTGAVRVLKNGATKNPEDLPAPGLLMFARKQPTLSSPGPRTPIAMAAKP
jgi:hypothetical protein